MKNSFLFFLLFLSFATWAQEETLMRGNVFNTESEMTQLVLDTFADFKMDNRSIHIEISQQKGAGDKGKKDRKDKKEKRDRKPTDRRDKKGAPKRKDASDTFSKKRKKRK